MKQRTQKHAANLIGLEAACTLPEQSRLPKCLGGGSRTSKDPCGPADISALLPNAGWLSSHVRPHQREVCPPCGWGDVATPIRPITGRPSLAPSSFTRCPVGSSCGFLSGGVSTGGQRAYHVPQAEHAGGLGRVSSPVVRHLRRGSSEPRNLTTCLLAQAYLQSRIPRTRQTPFCGSTFGLPFVTTFNDASPGLTMPPHPRPRPP